MASPKVRTDYEELKQLVSGFQQAGEAAQQSLQAIRREKDTLQGGDWMGKGATAFFKEMDDSVLPTLSRLVKALNSAASTTSKISGLMKQAEDEASSVFKGEGGGRPPVEQPRAARWAASPMPSAAAWAEARRRRAGRPGRWIGRRAGRPGWPRRRLRRRPGRLDAAAWVAAWPAPRPSTTPSTRSTTFPTAT